MVALPGDEDITTTDLLAWVEDQGQFLNPTEMVVLYYLAGHTVTTSKNSEGAPRGQVYYQASRYSAIMAGTGIKSENTVRTTLNALQEKAYVFRTWRKGEGPQPLKIGLLYDEDCDRIREGVRQGEALDPRLLIRPRARGSKPRLASVTPLNTLSI